MACVDIESIKWLVVHLFPQLIALVGILGSIFSYNFKQRSDRKDRLERKKLEKYSIFMSSLPGLCHPVKDSPPEITSMRKEFILNFYRIYLSCSQEDIDKISKLIEGVKVGNPYPSSDEEKDTQMIEIINFFRKDLGLNEISKFNHYGWYENSSS